MAISTGLWHTLSNSPLWACLTLYLLEGWQSQAWPGFHFTVQKSPVPGSGGASLAKRPHLQSWTENHLGGKKFAGGSVSTTPADTRRRGAVEVSSP